MEKTLLSFAEVEDRLVEAMRLCWQDEGGAWPFAGDGPWSLIRKEWWDWDARDAKALPRMPMSRAQMARRDEAVGWLALVAEKDRRLVVLAVRELAKGKSQVPWRDLLAPMGKVRGADGLRMRYGRALNKLSVRINARCVVTVA
tara:strand:+ start:195 stop:626 length:432 start_codon:yes stop_codon:yes gene_type:complete